MAALCVLFSAINQFESLLGQPDRFPAVPQPPGRHAVRGQVIGVEFRGFICASEMTIGGAPITARVRISRG
jgi:hypothetical protein